MRLNFSMLLAAASVAVLPMLSVPASASIPQGDDPIVLPEGYKLKTDFGSKEE